MKLSVIEKPFLINSGCKGSEYMMVTLLSNRTRAHV